MDNYSLFWEVAQWWQLIAVTVAAAGGAIAIWAVASDSGGRNYACPNGHSQWGRRLRYCRECGSRVHRAPVRRCPNGHKITATDQYCPRCGRRVNAH